MIIIFGDIGNTVVKLSFVENSNLKIIKKINLKTDKITSETYLKSFFEKNLSLSFRKLINKAIFSSVVPKVYSIFNRHLLKNFKIKCIEIKDMPIKKILTIDVKQPSQVGSDRIANAIAAYKIYKKNFIIVDFGTATTFDIVSKDGYYKGGIISPGIELSLKSLNEYTSSLPLIKFKRVKKVIGKNTFEAMYSGFFWGYSGLIKNIILKVQKDLKTKYNVIFTGGLAEFFVDTVKKKAFVDRDLTIKGLIEIYKSSFKYYE